MKIVAILTFALGLVLGGAAHADDADAVSKAEAAAVKWLALADAADYSATWEQSAGLFKTSVSRASWEGAIRGARAPLGAVESRKLASAQFTRSLPGVPDGEYVVLRFESRLAKSPAALETVTATKDKDGTWRVSGYYIK